MYVGIGRLTFHLSGNDSLIERLRQRFNVAGAEVGGLNRHQPLVIGLTCISNEAVHVSEMRDNALRFVQGQHLDAELTAVQREIIDEV